MGACGRALRVVAGAPLAPVACDGPLRPLDVPRYDFATAPCEEHTGDHRYIITSVFDHWEHAFLGLIGAIEFGGTSACRGRESLVQSFPSASPSGALRFQRLKIVPSDAI